MMMVEFDEIHPSTILKSALNVNVWLYYGNFFIVVLWGHLLKLVVVCFVHPIHFPTNADRRNAFNYNEVTGLSSSHILGFVCFVLVFHFFFDVSMVDRIGRDGWFDWFMPHSCKLKSACLHSTTPHKHHERFLRLEKPTGFLWDKNSHLINLTINLR